MNIIRRWIEDFKAYRRGEVRISKGDRGRVYADRIEPEKASGGHSVSAGRGSASLHIKVTRADGTVEEQTVPAKVHYLGD